MDGSPPPPGPHTPSPPNLRCYTGYSWHFFMQLLLIPSACIYVLAMVIGKNGFRSGDRCRRRACNLREEVWLLAAFAGLQANEAWKTRATFTARSHFGSSKCTLAVEFQGQCTSSTFSGRESLDFAANLRSWLLKQQFELLLLTSLHMLYGLMNEHLNYNRYLWIRDGKNDKEKKVVFFFFQVRQLFWWRLLPFPTRWLGSDE